VALAVAPALATAAMAEPVGFRYEIMWGGFRAGAMAITRDDATPLVETRMSIRTEGMFKSLFPFTFDAEGASRRVGPIELASEHYETRFTGRYQDQVMRTVYGPSGEARVVRDEVLAMFEPPPADDTPNPPVPPELRRGVADPLTNMALAGRRAAEAVARGESLTFRTISFDGKRAYAIDTKVIGRRRISMFDRDYDTLLLAMTLRPLAGFKSKFIKVWDGAEYEVDVDPATRLPLRIRTDSFAVTTVFNALAPCLTVAAQCMPPAEQ